MLKEAVELAPKTKIVFSKERQVKTEDLTATIKAGSVHDGPLVATEHGICVTIRLKASFTKRIIYQAPAVLWSEVTAYEVHDRANVQFREVQGAFGAERLRSSTDHATELVLKTQNGMNSWLLPHPTQWVRQVLGRYFTEIEGRNQSTPAIQAVHRVTCHHCRVTTILDGSGRCLECGAPLVAAV
jgi:hypothetical protein